jgi:hypothetical protein
MPKSTPPRAELPDDRHDVDQAVELVTGGGALPDWTRLRSLMRELLRIHRERRARDRDADN